MACQISSTGVARSMWWNWYRSMWSVCSRLRLASTARRMLSAESLWWLGQASPSAAMFPYTLVASTTLSRRSPPLANQVPRISSVRPLFSPQP